MKSPTTKFPIITAEDWKRSIESAREQPNLALRAIQMRIATTVIPSSVQDLVKIIRCLNSGNGLTTTETDSLTEQILMKFCQQKIEEIFGANPE